MTQVTTHNPTETCTQISDGYSLLDLARGWLGQGNTIVSLELLRSGLESREVGNDNLLRASTLKEIGRAHMMDSNWADADLHLNEAQYLFRLENDLKGTAECARNRANMWFQRGDFAKSEALCEEALDPATQLGDPALRATILNTLGAIYSATGDYAEAIKTLKLCLADFEASGNKARQGYVLLNIGLTQVETGEYLHALESLNKALALAMQVKDLTLVEITYQNIAKCYLEQRQPKLAQSAAEFARKILPGLSSKALEAELVLIEGRVLRACGRFDVCRTTLGEAHRLASASGMDALEAEAQLEQGRLEVDCGNLALATTTLEVAMKSFTRLKQEKGIQEVVRLLDIIKNKTP